jgi:phosphopantothenoylcysteine synthetase/decarboxylase
LTSIVLATEAPLLLAPRDERQDVDAPRDGCKRRNPQTTRRQFHRPEKGMLACGYEGIGRLWPVDAIVAKALEYKKR